jgi:hypothetical protein
VTRRVLLRGLGGLALTHVVGCAATAREAPPPARAASGPPPRPEAPPPQVAPPPEPTAAPVEAQEPADGLRRLRLPPRQASAETGSAFLARTESFEKSAFEDAVFEAIAAGNVPPFERVLLPVAFTEAGRAAVVHVLCDYLAIGSDEDFLRMPMSAATAQRIANLVDCVLPTRKLVDVIYKKASGKLPPSFIEGGPDLSHREDFVIHHTELEAQRAKRRLPLGALTAGDKKDIVITNRLTKKEDRVAIYGWHRDDGTPIQPLSTVHGRRYADYSHGVRLVDQRMTLDGAEHRVADVLRDATLSGVLSDEGPLEVVSYPTTLPPPQPSKKTGARPKRRARKARN